MKLVVGLGNPGIEYQHNRHNIGFLILDAFAQKHQLTKCRSKRYDAYEWDGTLFMKPKTFMNRSGDAVLSAFSSSKIEETLIIVDDFNLEFGQIRLRNSGGSGGHNGLKSIEEALGTNEYKRMRIGIGNPESKMFSEYVLSDFSEKEKDLLLKIYDFTNELLTLFVKRGYEDAVSLYSKNKTAYSKEFENLRIV
jgi:PTH1 family peptidyl-tRNA hydrolase